MGQGTRENKEACTVIDSRATTHPNPTHSRSTDRPASRARRQPPRFPERASKVIVRRRERLSPLHDGKRRASAGPRNPRTDRHRTPNTHHQPRCPHTPTRGMATAGNNSASSTLRTNYPLWAPISLCRGCDNALDCFLYFNFGFDPTVGLDSADVSFACLLAVCNDAGPVLRISAVCGRKRCATAETSSHRSRRCNLTGQQVSVRKHLKVGRQARQPDR